MASDFDLDTAMDRLVEMQKESVTAIVGSAIDAVKYFPYQQEAFPYWTNRLGPLEADFWAEDVGYYPFRILSRLVLGHHDEGYNNSALSAIYSYMPEILNYFESREMLTSSTYPDEFDDLAPDTGLEIEATTPLAVFLNSGIGVAQVGVEFTFLMPFITDRY